MTYELLNTLYVTLEGAYLRLNNEAVEVVQADAVLKRVPLHHLSAIVMLGNISASPPLMERCAKEGRSMVWLDETGRFRARVEGPVSGNVLLRRAQHNTLNDPDAACALARSFVRGKLHNQIQVLQRAARERSETDAAPLRDAVAQIRAYHQSLETASHLDAVRGAEGYASKVYFDALDQLITAQRVAFRMHYRTRRPPRDRFNALLSFVYSLLTTDCVSALEGVGLDPQVGYLHALRPGRPALALDLMEELRPAFADRFALSLVNLQQITPDHFEERPGGAVLLNDTGRRELLVAYQKRKQELVQHPVLNARIPWGLVPHIQARLLARVLRGDIPEYPPFQIR
ncbi:MAG: type I-C CRISPR-associated endonuclease Cas1c [Fimbriimonadales bacterium]|nr:type I-C CRISPR-associated endonuclease Cas1c [Fimbriimonadales bacterium]